MEIQNYFKQCLKDDITMFFQIDKNEPRMMNDKSGWIHYILNRINTEKTHEQRKK